MPTMNTIPDLPVSSHLCILGIYSADCDGERGMVLNETDLLWHIWSSCFLAERSRPPGMLMRPP